MKALEDNGLLDKFWELCEKYFGYQSENPNVDDLAACMLLTYASVSLKDTLPAVLKSYVLKKKNDVVVFVWNLMAMYFIRRLMMHYQKKLTRRYE